MGEGINALSFSASTEKMTSPREFAFCGTKLSRGLQNKPVYRILLVKKIYMKN